jgi:tetratricopeptide (TPR) repeat protein
MPVSRRRTKQKTKANRAATASALEIGTVISGRTALEQLFASLTARDVDVDPLSQAQSLMWDAFDEPSKPKRIALAKRALKLSPDCADAYQLLAREAAKTPEEAINLYAKGVAAGERAIGPETFEDGVGHFWGILETRPYMRARHGLAMTLWQVGCRTEAVDHFRDMLRLCPGDNMGLRYLLAGWLLEIDDRSGLDDLLAAYPDDGGCGLAYAKALHEFRKSATGKAAQLALKLAIVSNPHVPSYLLGKAKIPATRAALLTYRGKDEAYEYARDSIAVWRQTPGALQWLASHSQPVRNRPNTGKVRLLKGS